MNTLLFSKYGDIKEHRWLRYFPVSADVREKYRGLDISEIRDIVISAYNDTSNLMGTKGEDHPDTRIVWKVFSEALDMFDEIRFSN